MRLPTPIITLLTGAGLGVVLLIASTQATPAAPVANGSPSGGGTATASPSGSPSASGTSAGTPSGSLPAIPGCDSGIASAADLTKVLHTSTAIGGRPFSVAVSPDGKWSFVTTGHALAVLSNGSGGAPSLVHTLPMTGASKGVAVTHDGRYLVLAAGSGAKVLSAADAEHGTTHLIGTLRSAGGAGAVQVELSPDDQFAYVTLQDSNGVAVFNLKHALSSGFDQASFVGTVQAGQQPVGIRISADPGNKWLFVTNWGQHGTITVLSRHLAETDPAKAVLTKTPAPAGCNPSRIVPSANGRWVFVTAQSSNALLGYDATKLRTDPAHALVTVVPVGENPIGMVYIDGGREIMVANSGGSPNLMVISTHAALCRASHPVTGSITAGKGPRDFGLAKGSGTLYVTNLGAGLLEAIRLDGIPPGSTASSCR